MKKALATLFALLMMVGAAGMIGGCEEPPEAPDDAPEENGL